MRATERHSLRSLSATAAALAAAWALAPGPAGAELVRYDFEGTFFSEAPQPVLDHCVVEDDGVYHLFYLRGNPAVNIGHAITTDFVHWDIEPPVLTLGTWDNKAMWAPYLIPLANGGWAMYYTGVNLLNSQQAGISWSTSLYDWFKWPDPVYHPDPVWAEWTESGFAHGRDPHVVLYDGRYYMFNTAKTNTNRGAVACAVSDNLLDWEDIGPIYVHDSWHVLESVFILQRPNGKWHMFFTEETVNGTSHMYSDSLLTGWDIGTRRVIDFGHAPQITDTHIGQLFSRHAVYNDSHGTQRYVLRFTPMLWLNDQAVVPRPLALAGQWTFVPGTGDGLYYQPTFGNNAFVRNENYASTFQGDCWINTYEYYTGPLGYGIPGQYFGDSRTGIIRSNPFTIEGNSMNLLVGGGDYPSLCYVALVDAQTAEVLFRETGRNSNEMDRRYWSLTPHIGKSVYLEIADMSAGAFGHICVDDIVESGDVLLSGDGGTGGSKQVPSSRSQAAAHARVEPTTRLLPNSPNPFNPSTTIGYQLARDSHVRVDVFDARGAHIRTLVDGREDAGAHRVAWNGTDGRESPLASGVYFYRLTVDGRAVATRKMALLK
jgi:hypothetical protein